MQKHLWCTSRVCNEKNIEKYKRMDDKVKCMLTEKLLFPFTGDGDEVGAVAALAMVILQTKKYLCWERLTQTKLDEHIRLRWRCRNNNSKQKHFLYPSSLLPDSASDRHKIEKRFIFRCSSRKKGEQKKVHAKIKRLEAIMVCNRIFFAHVRILAMGRVWISVFFLFYSGAHFYVRVSFLS